MYVFDASLKNIWLLDEGWYLRMIGVSNEGNVLAVI